MASATTAVTAGSAPTLRRTLGLWDLILYGIVVIQPTAPMPVFGVVSERAHGHVVTAGLISMLAMLFSALRYRRKAPAYPSPRTGFTHFAHEIYSPRRYPPRPGCENGFLFDPL